jgi:hypothetical protein
MGGLNQSGAPLTYGSHSPLLFSYVTPLVTVCDTSCDTRNSHETPVLIGL